MELLRGASRPAIWGGGGGVAGQGVAQRLDQRLQRQRHIAEQAHVGDHCSAVLPFGAKRLCGPFT